MQNYLGNADSSRAGSELVLVHFEFTHPTAKTVNIAGAFNQWKHWTSPMTLGRGGRWVEMITLTPGTYEYCLVVDGQWIADPLNQVSVANPFGGRNSLMTVEPSAQQAHLTNAQEAPLENAYEKESKRIQT
jgi:1,4-alpha-glucan branching enzyme